MATRNGNGNGKPWLEVDVEGLRKILERKGKAWAIFELVQNAWDEDATEVAVTLTEPQNGVSTLLCLDNSPNGYRDLSKAHRMFAESYKKADPTKRGRFNVGEKYVLALCDEARITSTTGTILFNRDKTRSTSTKKTKAGSEFYGELQLTPEEYEEICTQVRGLIPPNITTTFNGEEIPDRIPTHTFQFTLPTEIEDQNGVPRSRRRKTELRLYKPNPGEKPTLCEKGIPVVEIEGKWHVDVQQKVPLNIERDNVQPSYIKAVYVAVLENTKDDIHGVDEATEPWVRTAMVDKRLSKETVRKIATERFGEKRVSYDPSDIGSNKEAVSQGYNLVTGGSMSKEEWKAVKRAEAMKPAGKVCPTNLNLSDIKPIDRTEYTSDQELFTRLIETVSPLLIDHTATVRIINEKKDEIKGCSRWKRNTYLFTINLAYHDCSKWADNYGLLLHELAHHKVQSNDHLCTEFWSTLEELAGELTRLALEQPELFPVPVELKPEEPAAVAAD